MTVDGWTITRLSGGRDGWQAVKDGRLIIAATQAELYRLIAAIEADEKAGVR